MNTHALRLPGLVYLLIAVAIAAVAAGALLLSSGDRALGDGGPDSPAECKTTGDTVAADTFTAPSGEVVTGVCIKSGEDAFAINGTADPKHSVLITVDGAYGINGCFVVSGLGTPTVTVTLDSQASGCKDVSHIDVNTGPEPTPTPTATPTATGTAPAEATPAATPTPTAAVLGETQEPAALPVSGGAPEEAIVSSLYLLLGLAGLALLIGGGTLVAVAVRRRR